MENLNYHHLRYFVIVAQEGSVAAASRRLGVGPPAISAQIKNLERSLGVSLFRRVGNGLQLTAAGETALRHGEQIFERGHALVKALDEGGGEYQSFRVGVANVVPKLVAFRLLAHALGADRVARVIFREEEPMALFSELALRNLDLVLNDAPLPSGLGIRGVSHRVGKTQMIMMGHPDLVDAHRDGFPDSLEDAPVLMPGPGTALRRSLGHWFAVRGLHPNVRAEFDDSALMKVFGQAAWGLFPAPATVEQEIQEDFGVRTLGSLEGLDEEFFIVTPEARHAHSLVDPVIEGARAVLT